MSNDNNAPFVSTANYAAATGVSTSPFTDQRAVIEGGGGGGGAGNMVYENGSINVDDGSGTGNVKITSINQGDVGLAIASSSTSVTSTDGGLFLGSTSDISAVGVGNFSVSANDIDLNASGDVNVFPDGDFDVRCGAADITSTAGDVSASAAGNLTLSASNAATLTGSDISVGITSTEFVTVEGDNIAVGTPSTNFVTLTGEDVTVNASGEFFIEAGEVEINSNDCKIATGTTPQPDNSPYFEIVDAVNGASFQCLRPAFANGNDAVRMDGFGVFDMTGDLTTEARKLITQRWVTVSTGTQDQGYITILNI